MTIGADLRAARERAGLSLHDLSARTKIREPILESIERDDFQHVPSGLLTRGFLRAYAREVRLDPETIVRRYRDDFESVALPLGQPLPVTRSEEELLGVSGRRPWLMAVAALALATVLFIYLNRRPPSPPAVDLSSGRNAHPDSAAAPETAGKPDSATSPDRAVIPPDISGPLEVTLHPTSVVWVQATSDGRRVLYTLLYPGQRTLIQAKQGLVLLVGDAGAVEYSINGVRGRQLGSPGQVREVQITRDNRASFLEPSAQ